MKRNKRRLAAFLVAAALIVGTLAISFADEPTAVPTTTITVTTIDKVAQQGIQSVNFAAFRVLDVTTAEANGETIYKYSVRDKYRVALQTITGKRTDNEIITYISKLDADGIRQFADDFYNAVDRTGLTPDETTTSAKFENVPQGYYLIVETEKAEDRDVISLVMLDTAAKTSVNVETKEDVPSTEKKVKDINDSTDAVLTDWQDSADYDIGDTIPFLLKATLPSNYGEYETYTLTFHDTEGVGLKFIPSTVVVKVDGNVVSNQLYSVVTASLKNNETFNVVIPDVKAITSNPASVITVEYSSTLTEQAIIGRPGNPNKLNITYSNNPYDEGEGQSPDDVVVVFTYKTVVNKVDGDQNPLKGAGFTLYKFDKLQNKYLPVSDEIAGEDITTFVFKGIDDGLYKLVETTVPEGFNQAPDIEFEVTADHEILSADPKLLDLNVGDNQPFVIDVEAGSLETTIENLTGHELPSTGGMGTTLIYIAGGALVLIAGIVLIARKKANSTEE